MPVIVVETVSASALQWHLMQLPAMKQEPVWPGEPQGSAVSLPSLGNITAVHPHLYNVLK